MFQIYNNPLSCNQSLTWLKLVDTTWITVSSPEQTLCAEPPALYDCSWASITAYNLNTDYDRGISFLNVLLSAGENSSVKIGEGVRGLSFHCKDRKSSPDFDQIPEYLEERMNSNKLALVPCYDFN